jgi:translation initiation factor 1
MPKEVFKQKEPLVCKFEKKGRNGKPVTLIEGWEGDDEGLKEISKKSKQHLELVARKKTASSSSRATTVTK